MVNNSSYSMEVDVDLRFRRIRACVIFIRVNVVIPCLFQLVDKNLKISRESIGINLFDAVATGTSPGIRLAVNVGAIVLVFLLAFALDWAAFPLAVLALAPSMDFEDHVLRYIPALNWARVLELVVLLPAAAIGGAEPGGLGVLFRLALMIIVLVYHWFVAKSALEVTGPQAAFLVGLNLVMGFIISLWALSLIR
ncbi:MAG: hypothetical protein IIC52_06820 [Proteobacteria bacterium]|nr:hypothetical protein [Pseudomonadota bacterium]